MTTTYLPFARPAQPQLRRFLPTLLLLLTVFGPISMDLYLPALPALTTELGAVTSVAQLTVTTCLIGLALGQLIAGPVSDQFGRRRVLLTGVAAYVVTSALCAASPSIEALIAARFIQGLAGGVGIVIGQAAGRDVFSGTQLIRFYGRLTVVGGLAAVIGPLLGGQLNTFLDWRGLFAFLALVGAILLAVIARQFPETLPYVADLDNAVIDTLLTHAWSMSSPRSYTIIFHLGGALTDVAPGSAVFDGRTGFAVNINGAWSDGEPDDRDWVKQEWTALHPHSRGVYVNFLDAEDADRVAAAYGDAGPALARLKRTYDPDNVFHHNHNIAPEGT